MEAAKAWVGAIGLVITALTAALADNVFDANEVGVLTTVLIEAAVTVYAIYQVPNKNFTRVPPEQ